MPLSALVIRDRPSGRNKSSSHRFKQLHPDRNPFLFSIGCFGMANEFVWKKAVTLLGDCDRSRNGNCRFGQNKCPILPAYSGLIFAVSLWVEKGQTIFRCYAGGFCIGFFALDRTKHGYAGHSNRQPSYDQLPAPWDIPRFHL